MGYAHAEDQGAVVVHDRSAGRQAVVQLHMCFLDCRVELICGFGHFG